MFYPDIPGAIIGGLAIMAILFLYKHADDLSDGNIDNNSTHQRNTP